MFKPVKGKVTKIYTYITKEKRAKEITELSQTLCKLNSDFRVLQGINLIYAKLDFQIP